MNGLLARENVIGTVVTLQEIEGALTKLAHMWTSTLHETAEGTVGWYRVLSRSDRVGVVATAQAMIALSQLGVPVPRIEEVVKSLLDLRNDGGWAFVSTVTDTPVVDATAWALIALSSNQDDLVLAKYDIQSVVHEAAAALQSWMLVPGGWGLTSRGPMRAYSTALAIRALVASGYKASRAVRLGVQALASTADPSSGAWRDSEGRQSVPVTAEAVRAIGEGVEFSGLHSQLLNRASRWLLRVGEQSDYWIDSPAVVSEEEVDYETNGEIKRIEYKYSPRATTISSLCSSGLPLQPILIHAVRRVVDGVQDEDWASVTGLSRREITSWMLHDGCAALASFRRAIPLGVAEVWANGSRVVPARTDSSGVAKFLSRRRVGLSIVGIGAILAVILNIGGVVDGYGVALIAFVASSLILGIAANAASAYLLTKRSNDHR